MTILHKFESAGLGKAPFRVVGFTEKVCSGQPGADGMTSGYAGQPSGTCAYCGTGIKDCFIIRSADDQEFLVGSDCVKKTGDVGLVDTVKREANRIKAQRQADRNEALVAARKVDVLGYIASQSAVEHPHPYYAQQGKTMADYLQFQWDASGTAARAKLVKKWLA